jgi:hypothetical protein
MERMTWAAAVLAFVTVIGLAGCQRETPGGAPSDQGMERGGAPSDTPGGAAGGTTGGGTTGGGAAGESGAGAPPSGSQ